MKKLVLISLCVLGVCAVRSYSASPCDELLKRVPNDVGFVVIVNDLRGNLERIQNSPFTKKYLTTFRDKRAAAAVDWQQLNFVNAMLKKEVGVDWAELRDGVIGDAVVFLYRPGPVDKPDSDEALVLMHARDPKLAERMFAHLDAAQKKSGQLKEVTTLTHAGRSYLRRIRTDEPDEFHYVNGALLVFGSSEHLLKEVINQDLKPQESAVGQTMEGLGLGPANIVWWVNARSFDAALAHRRQQMDGPEAAGISALIRHWGALDGAAISLTMERDAELRLTLAGRPDALPESSRKFLTEAASPSIVLSAFPDDALVTWSGRFSIPAALNIGTEVLPEAARKQLADIAHRTIGATLGTQVLTSLPDRLGPDWGICVMAPPADSKHEIPLGIVAVRLTDDKKGLPVVTRIVEALNTLATLAVVGFNTKHPEAMSLGSERHGEVDVRFVNLPAGYPQDLRPAFAWKEGYLLVGSHPDAIQLFKPQSVTSESTNVAPLIRINAQSWAKYIRKHREFAAGLLAKQDRISIDTATQQLDTALELLDLFQGIELSIRTAPGRATVSLKVKPVAPFAELAK